MENLSTEFMSILIIATIIISVIYYYVTKIKLNKRNCTNLSDIYTTIPPLNSIINSEQNKYGLRDFYIKTAYNCCCGGEFKNDFVNICALNTCIAQGVRCLDFEIYSIDDKPVIAASTVDDYTVKETYNSLPIEDAFATIDEHAFSSGTCPNASDPLILHFRIMSNNKIIYDKIAQSIKTILNSRILDKQYSYENHGENLGLVPISNFKEKVIILVDGTNRLYQTTKLDEYINMTSSSPFLHVKRFHNVKYTQDLTLTDFNKKNMTLVLPNFSANDTNPNFNIARQYGCQMIAMSFQNYDSNLEHYNAFFDGQKTAYVLKPAKFRYIPVTIAQPPPAPPENSYAPRAVTSDFYSYTI
jgi:hypothetical protein